MKTKWVLSDSGSGHVITKETELALGFGSRFRGLMFRKSLAKGQGLLLVPCASIHMFFMRFSIDAVMLDGQGRVLQVHRAIKPWTLAMAPRGTHAVLEMGAREAPEGILGRKLVLKSAVEGVSLPPKARFLAEK